MPGRPLVPPAGVVAQALAASEGAADVPALGERVADALRRHRVLEQARIPDEGPTGAGGGAGEPAQHRLRDHDEGGHPFGVVEQAWVEGGGEPPQPGAVGLLALLRGPSRQLRGSGDHQQVEAVLGG